jgi:hypothetical protein
MMSLPRIDDQQISRRSPVDKKAKQPKKPKTATTKPKGTSKTT